MRYELKRNKNGILTQCDTNADGGNIYAQREEINKVALKNLQRSTPGKLGNLSNLQVFNFQIGNFQNTSDTVIKKEYNASSSFPANVVDCIMFGVDSILNKALYYNIVDVKANVFNNASSGFQTNVLDDSYVEFYLLQNNETSTSSLGTKIPQPAPLFGSSSGTVNITTAGNQFGHQAITTSLTDDAVTIPQNSKGFRASGLALKTVFINFSDVESLGDIFVNFDVYVDVTSVSSTY